MKPFIIMAGVLLVVAIVCSALSSSLLQLVAAMPWLIIYAVFAGIHCNNLSK